MWQANAVGEWRTENSVWTGSDTVKETGLELSLKKYLIGHRVGKGSSSGNSNAMSRRQDPE